MDQLNDRRIIKNVINQYAQLRPSHGEIRLETVFDEQQDRYALMQVGWSRGMRVRGNLIYINLQDDTWVIEYDGIEYGLLDQLIEQGIPAEQIKLGYLLNREEERRSNDEHL